MDDLEKLEQEVRQHMTDVEELVLDGTRRAIAQSYQDFLTAEGLQDVPIVRFGYHTVIYSIVTESPFPIPNVQKGIEDFLTSTQAEGFAFLLETINQKFKIAMAQTRQQQHEVREDEECIEDGKWP